MKTFSFGMKPLRIPGRSPVRPARKRIRHVERSVLLQPGRQGQWVALRAQLVYLGQEWCRLTNKGLATWSAFSTALILMTVQPEADQPSAETGADQNPTRSFPRVGPT